MPVVSPPENNQIIEGINTLNDETVRFAGVEGEFSTIKGYYTNGLPFGNYYVKLIKENTSTLLFSEEFLIIDDTKIEFESVFYDPVALFITDIDIYDDYFEVIICEYGVNDWIVNTFYRYDGNSITELVNFIGMAFFDNCGKLVVTNNVGGNSPGRISDPLITRSYYELHYGKLEEKPVPIKGMSFTFADNDDFFNFYETKDAPTPEFASELIHYSSNFDYDYQEDEYYVDKYQVKDFIGQSFMILDYSEIEPSYRGAWYYVQLEEGRKGIIYWWLAG